MLSKFVLFLSSIFLVVYSNKSDLDLSQKALQIDNGGRLTFYSDQNSCTGQKKVFRCDGRCYSLNGFKAHSLMTSDFADGYGAMMSKFNDSSCSNYVGYEYVYSIYDNYCWDDNDSQFEKITFFNCTAKLE
ncbi:hypothetical protein M3Y97_00955900 [Aphelenchoides bicaudatus]|nr:hypothetical protein M3Y97_00955900 [Aphelenchoides bicaudatus]